MLELHLSVAGYGGLSLPFHGITGYLHGLVSVYERPIIGGGRVLVAYSTWGKKNPGRIASTTNSVSRLHRHPRSGTHTELFICCIRNCLGDTCCNRSLHFTNEGALEWWGVPASLNFMRSWGRSLSQSPVRLAIPLRFGQRAFWESVKLLTWDAYSCYLLEKQLTLAQFMCTGFTGSSAVWHRGIAKLKIKFHGSVI